jgi:hypothetical protein
VTTTKRTKEETKAHGKPKWLIMVYMSVDGWKANFAIESLKQLMRGASQEVVVAAQLGVESSGAANKYRRYFFEEKADEFTPIEKFRDKRWKPSADTNMADPKTLTTFIEWARKHRAREPHAAYRYSLVLWMDGVLPLYEPLARRTGGKTPHVARRRGKKLANGGKRTRYIQPYELRNALESARLDDEEQSEIRKKFDIVAMDACSMSMVEYAYELKDVAEYLLASEDAVPFWSLPYASILKHIQQLGPEQKPDSICKEIAEFYISAYQDYITGPEMGMNPVMLSTLRLGAEGIATIAPPLKDLADQLYSAATDGKSELGEAILKARQNSQDFAFGTFVDLADFCDKLGQEQTVSPELKGACQAVGEVVRKNIVKDNQVAKGHKNREACTGAMIYFPYFRPDQQQDKIDVVLDKGIGSTSGDALRKSAAAVSIATPDSHYAPRQEVIRDIEGYYKDKDFNFGQKTEWYKFIQCGWSTILAKNEPGRLDLRYSAEQCATNLVNCPRKGASAAKEPQMANGVAAGHRRR